VFARLVVWDEAAIVSQQPVLVHDAARHLGALGLHGDAFARFHAGRIVARGLCYARCRCGSVVGLVGPPTYPELLRDRAAAIVAERPIKLRDEVVAIVRAVGKAHRAQAKGVAHE
jgi:hypothetical protein